MSWNQGDRWLSPFARKQVELTGIINALFSTDQEAALSSILSAVESKLATLPLPVRLTLPDGNSVGAGDAAVHLTIHETSTLGNLAAGQVGAMGEDYVEGKFDVEGSMRDLMNAAAAILPQSPVDAARAGMFTTLIHRLMSVWRHTIDRDIKQIQFHYDLSDDFYALWLDPRRVYSCAYFKDNDMTLAQAQEAKLDHICRKLRLRAGERFLDIGAGWAACCSGRPNTMALMLPASPYRRISTLM